MTCDRYMTLLDSGGWRDGSEYTPAQQYVYVKGFAAMARGPSVGIARRGKYETSYWWQPDGVPLALAIGWWKPFPDDGISPHQRWLDFSRPNDGRFVRPPEEVFEAAGADARLTPAARKLLLAMAGGAVLHENAWRWTEWTLQMPGCEPAKTTEGRGGILKLREGAFIARNGTLPPGRLERWFEFDWSVTDHGRTWIEANDGEKR